MPYSQPKSQNVGYSGIINFIDPFVQKYIMSFDSSERFVKFYVRREDVMIEFRVLKSDKIEDMRIESLKECVYDVYKHDIFPTGGTITWCDWGFLDPQGTKMAPPYLSVDDYKDRSKLQMCFYTTEGVKM